METALAIAERAAPAEMTASVYVISITCSLLGSFSLTIVLQSKTVVDRSRSLLELASREFSDASNVILLSIVGSVCRSRWKCRVHEFGANGRMMERSGLFDLCWIISS